MNRFRIIHRGTLVLALSLAVGVLALTADASGPPAVTKIRTAGWPGSVVSAFNAIWVFQHVGTGVYRINPRTNRVVKRIQIGENQCLPAAAGDGKLWTTNCWGETGRAYVYEIDARHNRVVHRYKGASVVFGDESLWMRTQDEEELLRIDPTSRVVIARIPLPSGVGGQYGAFAAAECDGSVWLNADTNEIRVDAATNKVAAVIPLPNAASDSTASNGYFSAVAAACAGGKAWVPNLAGLYSIDESSNTATRLPIAIKPNSQLGDPGLTASGNQVFVRTSDTTVTQVDSTTGSTVHVYPAGGGGGDQIAVGYGSVWIPAAASAAVWRDQLNSP